ncbi:MAG: bifunctional DNA-formamidopyrimidine glycosylase/DNA-(apurinic or apyrimidinic site) lyase [Pseudomonadota bacterium]
MPELPEVETVVRGLRPAMEGHCIVAVTLSRPDLRFPFPDNFKTVLNGARITALSRRAKYALADLDNGWVLVMHLGMSGSFRVQDVDTETQPGQFHHERSKDTSHDHVRFDMETGAQVIYNDPRRFGYMSVVERQALAQHKLFADIGVEPLGNALSADYLAARFNGKQVPMKAALLDQRIIAGLGNIYVCEALWRARISPRRKAASLVRRDGRPTRRLYALVDDVRAVLDDAIKAGGSSLRDYVHADGSLGYFQHAFSVYDQEGAPCPRLTCNGVIRRIVQSGRSTFYCPVCQR